MSASMGVMAADPNLTADDERRLAEHAAALSDGIEAALPGWVVRVVSERHVAWSGSVPAEVLADAERTGAALAADVGPQVRDLLALDVDAQWTNPLALVRRSARAVTAVLGDAGVPPVARDEVAERLHPEDVYDVGPATFADLDPALADLGIRWGAAKAHVHLQRRRREGQR